MQNNQKLAKNIINVSLLVLVVILIIQNIQLVQVNIFFFSLKIPLLLLVVGLFAIGWYTSKLTGGVIDPKKIRDSLSKAEDSVTGVVAKGIEETKEYANKAKDMAEDAVEKAKDIAEDVVEDANEVVKKATTTAKKTVVSVRKKAPTRRTPAKKTS